MAKSSVKDLTDGRPLRLILGFMIPLMFGLLFQQFYSLADTLVVGRFLGVEALSGVGSTSSVNFLILGFCNGICSGFAIPVAQKFGQKDFENLRKYVANIIWLGILVAAVMTAITAMFCKPILLLMNTKEEFFDEAYLYISIIFYGIPTTMLYNMLSGIIRSLGDSKTPLYFLIIASALNVILDLVTVLVFDMGVEGPALATVISQAVSGFLCLIYMTRKYDILKMKKGEMRPSLPHMKRLCGMGIPMGVQYSVTAVGSMILQSAVNSFEAAHVAAIVAGGKVINFFACPMNALGTTASTFAAQNLGAGKFDRIRKSISVFLLISVVCSVFTFVVIFFFGEPLTAFFVDGDDASLVADVIEYAQLYLLLNGIFYFTLGVLHTFRFSLQGLGYPKLAIFAGVIEMLSRVLIAWVFAPMFGFAAICSAHPIAWSAASLFLIPCYFVIMRRLETTRKIQSE